jgi:hypothetical protein
MFGSVALLRNVDDAAASTTAAPPLVAASPALSNNAQRQSPAVTSRTGEAAMASEQQHIYWSSGSDLFIFPSVSLFREIQFLF